MERNELESLYLQIQQEVFLYERFLKERNLKEEFEKFCRDIFEDHKFL